MSNFEKFISDFTHLFSGVTSVAGGVKTEFEKNVYDMLTGFAIQAGFVRREEFDNLSDRFEKLTQKLQDIEKTLQPNKNSPADDNT